MNVISNNFFPLKIVILIEDVDIVGFSTYSLLFFFIFNTTHCLSRPVFSFIEAQYINTLV